MGILLFLAIISFAAPLIADRGLGVSYSQTDAPNKFTLPGTANHILGTDDLGRDYFARLLYGGQVSFTIAIFAALLALLIGLAVGLVTGYFGGIIDDFMNWFIITLGSIPQLLLLLIFVAVFQPSVLLLILILGLLGWTGTSRLVRGQTLALRSQDFILSARSIGASSQRIMFRHILPNVFSLIIVDLALSIGGLILTEAGLSFLGYGVKPPTPSWGNMLSDAQETYSHGLYLVFYPGVFITVTVLCLFVIGDGLRDAFDPQLENKK